MGGEELKQRKFTDAEENLICILTIVGAGTGPYLIMWFAMQMGGLIRDSIMGLPPLFFFLFPSITSILLILSITRNISKAIISAVIATSLFFIILIYLGYRIPP